MVPSIQPKERSKGIESSCFDQCFHGAEKCWETISGFYSRMVNNPVSNAIYYKAFFNIDKAKFQKSIESLNPEQTQRARIDFVQNLCKTHRYVPGAPNIRKELDPRSSDIAVENHEKIGLSIEGSLRYYFPNDNLMLLAFNQAKYASQDDSKST